MGTYYRIVIDFSTDDEDIVPEIEDIIGKVLPYMVNNVELRKYVEDNTEEAKSNWKELSE